MSNRISKYSNRWIDTKGSFSDSIEETLNLHLISNFDKLYCSKVSSSSSFIKWDYLILHYFLGIDNGVDFDFTFYSWITACKCVVVSFQRGITDSLSSDDDDIDSALSLSVIIS